MERHPETLQSVPAYLRASTSSLEKRKLGSAELDCVFSIFSSISSYEEAQARQGCRSCTGDPTAQRAWTPSLSARSLASAPFLTSAASNCTAAPCTGCRKSGHPNPTASPQPCSGGKKL